MAPIAFIDLEASGLVSASWPIEVGWCFEKGRPEAMLIKPHEDWPDHAWDPAAEQLHGIKRAKLARAGKDLGAVCNRMNDVLTGYAVYSDAPDWDGFWLYRLFSAAKIRQRFTLDDFGVLFADQSAGAIELAKTAATRKAPHKHRAKADVLHMRALFELAGTAPSP